jgi:hypothetical protein
VLQLRTVVQDRCRPQLGMANSTYSAREFQRAGTLGVSYRSPFELQVVPDWCCLCTMMAEEEEGGIFPLRLWSTCRQEESAITTTVRQTMHAC